VIEQPEPICHRPLIGERLRCRANLDAAEHAVVAGLDIGQRGQILGARSVPIGWAEGGARETLLPGFDSGDRLGDRAGAARGVDGVGDRQRSAHGAVGGDIAGMERHHRYRR
jgi:hypothetical protein